MSLMIRNIGFWINYAIIKEQRAEAVKKIWKNKNVFFVYYNIYFKICQGGPAYVGFGNMGSRQRLLEVREKIHMARSRRKFRR